MGKFFDMDNSFFRFMGKIADLIMLNILFILGCIPILTIGTSVSATYYVALKMVRGHEPYIAKNYFKAFKENLLQTVLVELIMAVITFVLYLDYYLIYNPNTSLGTGSLILMIAISIIYGMITLYIFPYIAQFKNTIPRIIQNCLFMSIRHFGQTITLFMVTMIPVWALFLLGFQYYSLFIIMLFFFGFSGIMFVNSIVFVKVFDKYIPETVREDAPEERVFEDESRVGGNSNVNDENDNQNESEVNESKADLDDEVNETSSDEELVEESEDE